MGSFNEQRVSKTIAVQWGEKSARCSRHEDGNEGGLGVRSKTCN